MITVQEVVQTRLDPQRAFAYLSRFENISEWDPGTPVSRQISAGDRAIGTQYYAEAEFRGKRQPIEYTVTELGDSRVQLRGENKRVISVDTIEVAPGVNGGSAVTYTAEFNIKGFLMVIEPFMKSTFEKLGKPAADGMRNKLDSLATG